MKPTKHRGYVWRGAFGLRAELGGGWEQSDPLGARTRPVSGYFGIRWDRSTQRTIQAREWKR